MPAIAPLVVSDGTDPQTYVPRGFDSNGVASFVKSNGSPISDKKITVSRSKVASSGREKVTLKLSDPVAQTSTINGVSNPTITRVGYVDITFTFDRASTLDERRALRVIAANLLNTQFIGGDVVDTLDFLY